MEETSHSLLERLRGDDHEAWRSFYVIYNPILSQMLRRRGLPAEVADDVKQEVLLIVSQEIRNFSHNGRTGAFRNWLRQILANRLRTTTRRYYREASRRDTSLVELGEQLADPRSEASQCWDREYDEALLRRLLELISPRFEPRSLSAFEQVVLQAKDVNAVAAELQMTVNAVRVAQSRILTALREIAQDLIE